MTPRRILKALLKRTVAGLSEAGVAVIQPGSQTPATVWKLILEILMAIAVGLLGLDLSRSTAAEKSTDGSKDRFFIESVRPLLSSRCVSCHGPEKAEGGLRLDSRAAALKGGDSGPALVPG